MKFLIVFKLKKMKKLKRANATGVRLSLLPMTPRPDLSEYFLKTEILFLQSPAFQRNTRPPKVAYSNRFRPSTFIRCLHETAHVMKNAPQYPL